MSVYNEYLNLYDEFQIRLDSNEVFMDIDKEVRVKMKSCLSTLQLNRYPGNDMSEIKKLYGKYINTNPENIMVGNGSDEVLEIIIGKIVNKDAKVLTLGPDFTMYDFFTKKFDGQLFKFDIETDMEFDVRKFIEMGKNEDVDLIVFSNPNNPTGIALDNEQIFTILKAFEDKIVIVDEAYHEFFGKSVVSYINEYKNLIVTRTLSKAWGLAALRIGFLISNKEIINELLNYKVPYTISTCSQKLAEIALSYPEKVVENSKEIIKQRKSLYKMLLEIQNNAAMKIEFFNSNGNYIFGRTPHKEALIKGLRDKGIYIRNFNNSNSFRITVGSPMQNRKLVEAINKIFVY